MERGTVREIMMKAAIVRKYGAVRAPCSFRCPCLSRRQTFDVVTSVLTLGHADRQTVTIHVKDSSPRGVCVGYKMSA